MSDSLPKVHPKLRLVDVVDRFYCTVTQSLCLLLPDWILSRTTHFLIGFPVYQWLKGVGLDCHRGPYSAILVPSSISPYADGSRNGLRFLTLRVRVAIGCFLMNSSTIGSKEHELLKWRAPLTVATPPCHAASRWTTTVGSHCVVCLILPSRIGLIRPLTRLRWSYHKMYFAHPDEPAPCFFFFFFNNLYCKQNNLTSEQV